MPDFTRVFAALFPFRKSGGKTSSLAAFLMGADSVKGARSRALTGFQPGTAEPGADEEALDVARDLGNLFRARGDIDRAVALREKFLARPEISAAARAEVHYELGRDYHKAGLLDRALDEYRQARRLGHDEKAVRVEVAQLHADSGDFAAAASVYEELRNPAAVAHYLVRQAQDAAVQGRDDAALRLIKKALSAFSGSPEAWLALCSMALLADDGERLRAHLRQALDATEGSARLLLLEGLYALRRAAAGDEISPVARTTLVETLIQALEPTKADLVSCYYTGLFLQTEGRREEAEHWYTKAYVLQPDFWAPRLALLDLAAGREETPPELQRHSDFFVRQGAASRRFVCPSCGMRGDQIFSLCPRCRAWHSVSFRRNLQ